MAVRLFVGNMPYAATEADLRTHFGAVGAPSQVVIPVDRATGRPRGFAFVEYQDKAVAEQAISKFNEQPFMGRSLSVSEARPREERPSGFRPGAPPGMRPGGGGGGGFRSGPPPPRDPGAGRNFGPPKKSASSEKRWESKERGPKGPIKERYTGRVGALLDESDDAAIDLEDFDDIASSAPKSDEEVTTTAGSDAGEVSDAGKSGDDDAATDQDTNKDRDKD